MVHVIVSFFSPALICFNIYENFCWVGGGRMLLDYFYRSRYMTYKYSPQCQRYISNVWLLSVLGH